jgi:hypothetical protein
VRADFWRQPQFSRGLIWETSEWAAGESQALALSIDALRRNAGDF